MQYFAIRYGGLLGTLILAGMLAGCGTSGGRAPVNFLELAEVVNPLPGARGRTEGDQRKIDKVVANACSTGVLGSNQCALHAKVSREAEF